MAIYGFSAIHNKLWKSDNVTWFAYLIIYLLIITFFVSPVVLFFKK
jgi:hypothetical protein